MAGTRKHAGRNTEVTIQVTEHDIGLAVPKDSAHCMIADALRRARPDVSHVSVDLATIRWSDPVARKRYIALTPRPAQEALLDFDNNKRPAPFMFRVRPAQVVSIRSKEDSTRKKATVMKTNGRVPLVKEGRTPPTGPLAGGSAARTGRRREFGLRGMGR